MKTYVIMTVNAGRVEVKAEKMSLTGDSTAFYFYEGSGVCAIFPSVQVVGVVVKESIGNSKAVLS